MAPGSGGRACWDWPGVWGSGVLGWDSGLRSLRVFGFRVSVWGVEVPGSGFWGLGRDLSLLGLKV